MVARTYNLKKFVRFHKAQSGNMCKVEHQALSYVKLLSKTHLSHDTIVKYNWLSGKEVWLVEPFHESYNQKWRIRIEEEWE